MSDCIFCKIINGDFNTEFAYENEYAVVFKDINPKADTHLLVVPRKHVESLNELEKNTHFGRMDLTLNEDNHTENLVMYIGEKSINKGIENLVYDWRSPVGNLYYMSNQEDYKYKDTI